MDALKVLVVDDSPIIIKKLTTLLAELEYKVVGIAASGREAVALYKTCKPDVVTMDITMPDMDGITATRLILSENPKAKVVMVTSHGQEQMVLDALKAGARGYVLKPFQRHKLYQAIQTACNRVVLQEKLQSEIEQRTVQREEKKRLVENKEVKRSEFGVMVQEVNQDLAISFGLEKPLGALVCSVDKDGVAGRAGIESGDVILKFNDKEIIQPSDLPPLEVGSTAILEIWHKKQAKTISMKVDGIKSTTAEVESDTASKIKLGLTVRPLTSEERKKTVVSNDEGLFIEHVGDGPAAQVGIRSGDIILAVNGEMVSTAESLRKLVEKAGKRPAFHIIRGELKLFVVIRFE